MLKKFKKIVAGITLTAITLGGLFSPLSEAATGRDPKPYAIQLNAKENANGAVYKVVKTMTLEDSGKLTPIEMIEVEHLTIENGTAKTTEELDVGLYQVRPVKRAPGYLLDVREDFKFAQVQFPLMENGVLRENQVFEVGTKDRPVVMDAEFTKFGDDEKTPLDGVTFELRQTHKPLTIADDNTVETWEEISVEDQELNKQTVTTGADGKVTFPDLREGKYEFLEIKTKEGYEVNTNKNTFTVTVEDNKAVITDSTVTELNPLVNYLSPTVEKKIINNQREYTYEYTLNVETPYEYVLEISVPQDIKDYTTFKLYDELNEKLELLGVKSIQSGAIPFTEEEMNEVTTIDGNRVDFDFITKLDQLDPGGTITIILDAKILGTVVEVTRIPNDFTLIYNNGKDDSGIDKEKKSNEVHVDPHFGSVEFVKTTSDGTTPLVGAKFRIFEAGTVFPSGDDLAIVARETDAFINPVTGLPYEDVVTDETGVVSFENLPFGDYEIIEIEAPEGYNIRRESIPVAIRGEENVIDLTLDNVPNYKEEENVPGTGTLGGTLFAASGVSLLGIGSLLKRKKK